jgi:protein OS-9
VWHTINCNVLPKDYKETKVEEESKEKKIIIGSDEEGPSIYDSKE